MSKEVRHVCKNCTLYDPKNQICTVTFIVEGEDYVLHTKPEDECLLEKNGLLDDVDTAGCWSDGKNGYIDYGKNL